MEESLVGVKMVLAQAAGHDNNYIALAGALLFNWVKINHQYHLI